MPDKAPEAKAPAKAAASQSPPTAQFETIDLVAPITRGETTIDQLTVRKPKAGELRSLSLSELIALDITTLLKLLPRISEPALTGDECDNLDPSDLTEIGGAVRGFFMTTAERRAMDAMIAEQQPKT